MAIFTPNRPQPGDFPSDSQPQLLGDFNYLAGVGGKGLLRDHQMTLDTANANDGTHLQVTLTNEAPPGFAGGSSVVYANSANGQSQLFFQNAIGSVQLTTDITGVPTIAASGVTFLAGGLLLQWGSTSATAGSTITFPKAFSAPAYSVQVTTSSLLNITVGAGSVGATSFKWLTSGSGSVPFMWMAIGLA